VGLEIRPAAGKEVENSVGSEARAVKRLVDAVAGERVDKTGSVSDEQRASPHERIARPSHRQAEAAHRLEAVVREPVAGARPLEVLPQSRALRPPPADPDVDVIALRENPRIATRNGAELRS